LPPTAAEPITSITISDECIPVEENLPSDLVLSGVWLRNEATPYFENLDDHADYIVPFKGGGLFGEFAVSPDGKQMAYIDKYYNSNDDIEKRILQVIKSSGHSLQMDYWVEDWQWIIGWVNDQELALFNARKEIIVLNPFTGAWREMSKPDWLMYDDNSWYKIPAFSPTLEWILIRQYDYSALKDVQTGETILQPDDGSNMTWSANGLLLAVISNNTINLIDNGKQTKRINIAKLSGSSIRARLSPKGGDLAFTANYYSPSFKSEFFLLDIDKLEIKKLCETESIPWTYPVWSPDNRFVIQAASLSYDEEFDLLIDTQEMRAYKLISGRYNHRIAWLAKP
jgi:hypothetical protein